MSRELTPAAREAIQDAADRASRRVRKTRNRIADDRLFMVTVAAQIGRALAEDQAMLTETVASPSQVISEFSTTLFAAYARTMKRLVQ